MKIPGICAFHGKSGGTYLLLEEAMKGVKEEDQTMDTRIIELAELKIGPCIATCGYDDAVGCAKRPPFECNVKDDLQLVFEEMKQTNGILVASPRYFIVPSKLQALIERLYCIHYWTRRKNPSMSSPLTDKPFGILTTSSSDAYGAIARANLKNEREECMLWCVDDDCMCDDSQRQ